MTTSRPRILYVNKTARHGGAEEVLLRFMQAVRQRDYEPILLVPAEGWLTEQSAQANIPFLLLPGLPDDTCERPMEQFIPWFGCAARISRLIRRHGIALVHSNTPRDSYHGGLAARLAGIPTATHVHDIASLPYQSPLKARLLCGLCDWTFCVSKAVERAVLHFAPRLVSRIQTVYNGWNSSVYANVQPYDLRAMFRLPPETVLIGNVSLLYPWKGQDILIQAFAKLHADMPQARLLIVGAVPPKPSRLHKDYEARLHSLAEQGGVRDHVIFAGWREDVWPIMKGLDVFVHAPVQPDPLPTVLLHASGLGVPIIASETGGIPEIVSNGHSGLLVPPQDTTALCRALKMLAAEKGLQRTLGQGAKERFAAVFSEEQLLDGLAHGYEQCFAMRARRNTTNR